MMKLGFLKLWVGWPQSLFAIREASLAMREETGHTSSGASPPLGQVCPSVQPTSEAVEHNRRTPSPFYSFLLTDLEIVPG